MGPVYTYTTSSRRSGKSRRSKIIIMIHVLINVVGLLLGLCICVLPMFPTAGMLLLIAYIRERWFGVEEDGCVWFFPVGMLLYMLFMDVVLSILKFI